MRIRRRLPIALAVLAAAVLGLALFWNPGAPAGDGPPIDRESEVSAPGRVLEADGASAHDAPVRLEGLGSPAPDPETAAPPPPGLALRGLVRDVDGQPALRAAAMLEREVEVQVPDRGFGPTAINLQEVATRSTSGGAFAFEGLEPGRYRVTALAPPGRLAVAESVHLVDADLRVELTWLPTARAVVEVVDDEGYPIAAARVTARWGAVGDGEITDFSGVVVLEGLDPRQPQALRVTPPGADLFPYEDPAWSVRDTRVVLGRALEITGRVVDEHGAPFPGARVLRIEGQRTHIVEAGEDATFRLRGLRPGATLLAATAPSDLGVRLGEEHARRVTVEAGAQGVELIAWRGATLVLEITNWPEGARGTLALDCGSSTENHRVSLRGDGRATIHGLDAAQTYTVWATLEGEDERFAYRPDLRPQAEPVRLELEESEPILVRVEAPPGVEVRHVWAGLGEVLRSTTAPPQDGLWRLPGLPPGVWTVQAVGLQSAPEEDAEPPAVFRKHTHAGKAKARPGEEVTVVLEPVPDR